MMAILRREWVLLWREKGGNSVRCLYAGLLLLAGLGIWTLSWGFGLRSQSPDEYGAASWAFFVRLSVVQFFLASFLGAIFFARSVAREKESGALDLVVMSRLSAFEILLGGALGDLMVVGMVLAAGLPVLCFLTMLGGTDGMEVVSVHAVVVGQLMLTGGAAMMLAAVFDRFFAVMSGTVVITAALLAVPELPGMPGFVRWIAPFRILRGELAVPGADLAVAIRALGVGAACLVTGSAVGSFFLNRRMLSAPLRRMPLKRRGFLGRTVAAVANSHSLRLIFRPRLGGSNPLLARESAADEKFRMAWVVWVVLFLAVILDINVLGAGYLYRQHVLAEYYQEQYGYFHAPTWLNEWCVLVSVLAIPAAVLMATLSIALSIGAEKRMGSLEILLSADVQPREIVDAKMARGFFRAGYLLAPLVLAVLVFAWGCRWRYLSNLDVVIKAVWLALASAVVCVPITVWNAVRSRGPTFAAVRSGLFAVTAIGSLCIPAAFFGFVGLAICTVMLLPPVVGIYVATVRSLRKHALTR